MLLVTELPQEGTPSAHAVLWKGENVDFGTKLVEPLDALQIRGVAVPVELLFRNSRDFFAVAERPLFGSAVCVTRENYSAARRLAEKWIEEEPGEDQAGQSESVEKAGIPAPVPELPLEWDPATATIELWCGAQRGSLRFVADALPGVGIPTERRGREIVTEVLEGKPPD